MCKKLVKSFVEAQGLQWKQRNFYLEIFHEKLHYVIYLRFGFWQNFKDVYWVFSRSHLLHQSLSLNNYKNGSFCKLICFLSLANTRHTRTKKRYKEYRPIGCYLKRAVTKYLWLSSRIPIFIVFKQVNTTGLQWRKKSLSYQKWADLCLVLYFYHSKFSGIQKSYFAFSLKNIAS